MQVLLLQRNHESRIYRCPRNHPWICRRQPDQDLPQHPHHCRLQELQCHPKAIRHWRLLPHPDPACLLTRIVILDQTARPSLGADRPFIRPQMKKSPNLIAVQFFQISFLIHDHDHLFHLPRITSLSASDMIHPTESILPSSRSLSHKKVRLKPCSKAIRILKAGSNCWRQKSWLKWLLNIIV